MIDPPLAKTGVAGNTYPFVQWRFLEDLCGEVDIETLFIQTNITAYIYIWNQNQ